MKNVIWYSNERIGLEDIGDATGQLPFDELKRLIRLHDLPAGRTTGAAQTSARLFSGFALDAWTPDVTVTLRVNEGTGIFPVYENGQLVFGAFLGGTVSTYQDLALGGYADGSYGLWVRFVRSPSVTANRHFWSAAGGAEYQDNQATRLLPAWEITLTAVGNVPGHGEWVQIYAVDVLAGKAHDIVDYRHWFFEGSTPDAYADEWGSATDRNADRTLYGIGDFHRFVQALRMQLKGILGAAWYTAAARSLAAMAVEHKVSGVHGAVTADSMNLQAGAPGLVATPQISVAPRVGDVEGILLDTVFAPEALRMLQIYQRADVGTPNVLFLTINREGMFGSPVIFREDMCLAVNADISNVVPGRRWGKYYSPAPAAAPTIGTEAAQIDPTDGGGMNVKIVTGGTNPSFAGIRTGGDSNTQAGGGWFLISRRPKCICAFRLPSWVDCDVYLGFRNDLAPLDTDPSRAEININITGAGGMIRGTDGTVTTGALNLLGGVPVADTLYVFALDVINASRIRVRCINTGISETFTKALGAPMLEVNGGVPVCYSFAFIIAQNGGAATTAYLKRFHLTDESFIGP